MATKHTKKNYRQDAPTGIGLNQLTLNNLTMQLQSKIQHNTTTCQISNYQAQGGKDFTATLHVNLIPLKGS